MFLHLHHSTSPFESRTNGSSKNPATLSSESKTLSLQLQKRIINPYPPHRFSMEEGGLLSERKQTRKMAQTLTTTTATSIMKRQRGGGATQCSPCKSVSLTRPGTRSLP
ncbi:hypothetical protein CEXT_441591 [Caerostris extrusa]|uniref:Uncharacterized protein n=1 Tax=Caerostris extrusa TaxID=172846 RepID=A0AAV4X8K6_CAEEX|nr:hypothetical protein CEXT_441591 [Caerostris extrusa]